MVLEPLHALIPRPLRTAPGLLDFDGGYSDYGVQYGETLYVRGRSAPVSLLGNLWHELKARYQRTAGIR